METIRSADELDLSPLKGKTYWRNNTREWREEFIYFLMIDRFHDEHSRNPIETEQRQRGFGDRERLRTSCGGKIQGVTRHLDYIQDLGCTALWLSPLFENNPNGYHGYAIQDFLSVDPRFGSKQDLIELVDAAHARDMSVFLDVILHHSGDNWYYPGDVEYYYYGGATFPFGGWRYPDKPSPVELRNPELYWRKGQIRNFDAYPETREGDFCALKTFKNDTSPEGLYVQDVLTKVHCYWLRETDIDGFRIDAVKHMGERAVGQFCSHMREYAYKLGKRNFFLFGELVGPDELYNRYIGPKTSVVGGDQAIYYGLNSVLDFPLYHVLGDVIHGTSTPEKLIRRYESLRVSAMNRGEFGEFLVTFIDNHDQVGQAEKRRFGYLATEDQIIAGIAFLLCALGTPCIYYGTEQGFDGHGESDAAVREAMFNPDDRKTNRLNKSCRIYRQIREVADIRKNNPVLKFGRMYMREFSDDGEHFHMPVVPGCLLAFSRVLYDEEVVVAYNSSLHENDDEYVAVDPILNPPGGVFSYVYGANGHVHVLRNETGSHHFIRLTLQPGQFVILVKDVPHEPP